MAHIQCSALAVDATFLAFSTAVGSLRVFSLQFSGECSASPLDVRHPKFTRHSVTALTFSADMRLIVALSNGQIVICRVSPGDLDGTSGEVVVQLCLSRTRAFFLTNLIDVM